MNVTVAACQQKLNEPLSPDQIRQIRDEHADFVCLPEHYPLPAEVTTLREAVALFEERKRYLESLSRQIHSVIVGGTLTETTDNGYYNTCYVFDGGTEVGFYRKVHPTVREQEAGILRGEEFKVFDVRGIRIGVLICADVLNTDSFREMASQKCRIVFVPTASPLRIGESVEEKYERDRSIFLEGARIMDCPVVKSCGVGTTFGHPIQGRSLIATPERIITRAEPHQEQQALLLFATLTV